MMNTVTTRPTPQRRTPCLSRTTFWGPMLAMTVSWNSRPVRATFNWEARVAVNTLTSLRSTRNEAKQAELN